MRYCGQCDFIFAWPVPKFNAVDLYSRAYMGQESQAEMDDYHSRLARRAEALQDESLALRSRIQRTALKWLEANTSKGASVLEIGCGLGGFMHALRARGYHAVGNDVAEPVVRALEADGFKMWWGTGSDIPQGWPQTEPAAVACFFILHHLPDPVAFLSAIRRRWCVPLIIGQGMFKEQVSKAQKNPSLFPSRTVGWWSERSIERALNAAGYSIREMTREPRGRSLPLPSEARKRIDAALWRWPKVRVAVVRARQMSLSTAYHAARRIPLVRSVTAGELLVIASPT